MKVRSLLKTLAVECPKTETGTLNLKKERLPSGVPLEKGRIPFAVPLRKKYIQPFFDLPPKAKENILLHLKYVDYSEMRSLFSSLPTNSCLQLNRI